MEVSFTPEQEAQLAKIAASAGTEPERLVKEAALRLLQEDARFRAAIREGVAQADRGEFIEEEEMNETLRRMWDEGQASGKAKQVDLTGLRQEARLRLANMNHTRRNPL